MKEKGSAIYQLILLILSIYVLIALVIESLIAKDEEVKQVLQTIDFSICLIFLSDFFYNLYRAENKLKYLKWGWVDLLSSIPVVDPFRWGRLARVVRILRVFRAAKSFKILYNSILRSRYQSLTLIILLISFLTFSVSATLILEFERSYTSEIQTSKDALWWALLNILNAKVSLTQAQSPGGELVTIVLNKVGLLIFAYFNAMIVAWLLQKRKTKSYN